MRVTDEQVEAVVDRLYGHYRAEAVKRGRNPAFPYVPVYRFADRGFGQTTQIRGRAYETREQAIRMAERQIERFKQHARDTLRHPSQGRALRQQHGLPRELSQ